MMMPHCQMEYNVFICNYNQLHRNQLQNHHATEPVFVILRFEVGLKIHKMEIAQTGSDTWRWCMGVFGARFAVFVRRARVLISPCPATRNLS